MQYLLISLESEVRSFQDIRNATSARLEITFLDADAAAYVLIKAKLINSCFYRKALWLNGYVIAGRALWVPMCGSIYAASLLSAIVSRDVCVLFCLRLWVVTYMRVILSAYFVCEDRTLISFFKSGNTSDDSLEHFLAGWSKRWVHICAFFYAYIYKYFLVIDPSTDERVPPIPKPRIKFVASTISNCMPPLPLI